MVNLSGIKTIKYENGTFTKVPNKQLYTDGIQVIETRIMETLVNTASFFGTVKFQNDTVIIK